MKKSEIYRIAQIAVMTTGELSNDTKLEVISELQSRRETELFFESATEGEEAKNETN